MKAGLHMSASWPNSATLSNPKEKEQNPGYQSIVWPIKLNQTLFVCLQE